MEQHNNGWRTVAVDVRQKLCLRNECMVLIREEEDELSFPLSQIARVLIMSPEGSITIPLLNALAKRNITVLFCDEKRDPCCQLTGISVHGESAGCLIDQAGWSEGRKKRLWQQIVQNKIDMQLGLLELLQRDPPAELYACLNDVLPGDISNREGMAARLYFSALFGSGFIRHEADAVNAALDYGYALLRTAFSRAIALQGSHPALGIHHCSRFNPSNLSCDLMEPFRPFVDRVVACDRLRALDWPYKKELIAVLQQPCLFGKKEMKLQTAVEVYTRSVIRAMQDSDAPVEVIRFA